MDAEGFPTFIESGFYREWLRCQLIFPDSTEAQKRLSLELAYAIYEECCRQWEADGKKH